MSAIIPTLLTVAAPVLTKEVSKNLSEAFGAAKDFAGQAREIKDASDSLMTALGVINPFLVPLKLIVSEISSGTLDQSMATMESLLKLIDTDTFRAGIQFLINGINTALAAIQLLAEGFVKMEAAVTNAMDKLEAAIVRPIERIAERMKLIWNTVMPGTAWDIQ